TLPRVLQCSTTRIRTLSLVTGVPRNPKLFRSMLSSMRLSGRTTSATNLISAGPEMSRVPPSSPAVRRRMQATPQRDTPCELALRSAVHRLGLRYRVDWRVPGTRRRADLAFVNTRVLVFVDGCFWHGCPEHGTWPKANASWWRDKIEANQQRDR